MSQQTPQKPQPQGQYGKDSDGCEPPPPPPPCPDPCDEPPHWGPPEIPADCCPDEPDCCRDETDQKDEKDHKKKCCTWDEVEDPCVRAAACADQWTKVTCKCECKSSDPSAECDCKEWEGDCYSPCRCVPCKPCEGVIPDGDGSGDPGGCGDPGRDGCDSEGLQRQLDALKKCLSSQEGEKTRIEAEIKAGQERQKDLATLIGSFDAIVEKYRSEHYKLKCREDCLKGFHRDVDKRFQDTQEFPSGCLDQVRDAINDELCKLELARCCQVNLEGKLTRVTKLVWEKQEAEKRLKKAEDAFAAIKDLPKWIGDRFAKLEGLKDQIAQALTDKDPQKHKWAFYLFYWRFAPLLCGCFPVVICCPSKTDPKAQSDSTADGPAAHIGCGPGDWHPSRIDDKTLQKLICCAWDYARDKKKESQEKSAALDAVSRNLDFVKSKVKDDANKLEERIKGQIEKVECKAPPAVAEGGDRNA